MKHLVRAAVAALVPLTAAAAALLPAGPAAAAARPADISTNTALSVTSMVGTWTNINPNSTNVKNVVISATPDGAVTMDAFSACAPTACEWGNVPVVVFQERNTDGVDPTVGAAVRAEWTTNSGHNRNVLVAVLVYVNGVPILQIQEPHIFIQPRPGSDQPANDQTDYTVGEVFKRSTTPMTPTMDGAPVVDNYPMGNYNSDVDALVGTWTNASNTGFTKIVMSKNPDGSLAVEAFAACATGSCDWGPIYAVTFGPAPVSSTAANFLAPYTFGNKHVLLCTALNAGGQSITIHEFTDYTHVNRSGTHAHSGAGTNFNLDEVFTKVA